MARNGMTEEEAHRALRRRSMDCRIPWQTRRGCSWTGASRPLTKGKIGVVCLSTT